MISSFLKRLLLVSGYPRLMTFHEDVGAIQVRIPNSIQAQVFYPTTKEASSVSSSPSSKKKVKKKYFRQESVQGLIDYMGGIGDGILNFLGETNHPCHFEADPAIPPSENGYPLVFLSHGLAGSMELYSQLCSLMASHGYVVVAVEHEDGSGAYAEKLINNNINSSEDVGGSTPTTQSQSSVPIPYKRPNDEPYSRQKVLNLRTPMLEQRVEELEDVIKYFIEAKQSSTTDDTTTKMSGTPSSDDDSSTSIRGNKILEQLATMCIDPEQIHLVGHSFGGATQVMAAQKWTSGSTSRDSAGHHATMRKNSNFIRPKSVTVLDTWAFSLEDHVLETGLSTRIVEDSDDDQKTVFNMPILSVISESWTTNPETKQIIKLLQSTAQRSCRTTQSDQSPPSANGIHSYFCRHSVHQSFSDSQAWLPSFVARKVYSRGKHEERHATIQTVVDAWSRMVARSTSQQQQQQHSSLVDSITKENTLLVPFDIPGIDSSSEQSKQQQRMEVLTEATSTIST